MTIWCVLAVDPGTTHCGWAILRNGLAGLSLPASGVIDPGVRSPRFCTIEGCGHPIPISRCAGCGTRYPRLPRWAPGRSERVAIIGEALGKVMDTHRPDVLALETAWMGTHASAVIGVSETRGAALAAAAGMFRPAGAPKLEHVDVQPTVHKKSTTGTGNASKEEVRDAVNMRFGTTIESLDEADAVSIGLHVFWLEQVKEN
jgi:Holliday junction resolvasome RuvABC endonuclease subunit